VKAPKRDPKRLGRPPGKRSDPSYRGVTAWIRRDTYSEVRKRLFDEDEEFSVLVERLLQDWLGSPPMKRPRG